MRAPASWRSMSVTRSAAIAVSSDRSSSCCTCDLPLLFLATLAGPGPRDRIQPRFGNRLAALPANAVGTFFDAAQRAFDRLQDLGVSLFEFELNVDFIVAGGLVGHVALPAGVVLHRPLQRFRGRASEELSSLLEQRVPVYREVHRLWLLLAAVCRLEQ